MSCYTNPLASRNVVEENQWQQWEVVVSLAELYEPLLPGAPQPEDCQNCLPHDMSHNGNFVKPPTLAANVNIQYPEGWEVMGNHLEGKVYLLAQGRWDSHLEVDGTGLKEVGEIGVRWTRACLSGCSGQDWSENGSQLPARIAGECTAGFFLEAKWSEGVEEGILNAAGPGGSHL